MGRPKRSLETDQAKVSPPNKMPNRNSRSTSSDRSAEILTQIAQLKEKFSQIEKEVAEITKFVREVESLRGKVSELHETCESFQRLELKNKKRCVLLRGLSFKSEGKFETRQQTKAVLADFFGRVDMVPHLVDYQRLGGLRPNENGSKISIRVQFVDVDQKFDLFDKLKTKGRELQDVSVLTDYPSFQLKQFKQLSEAAYNIRKENPGTKTRIVPKGLGLTLQRRSAGLDSTWIPVSAPSAPVSAPENF
jgi:TolA-binding protein